MGTEKRERQKANRQLKLQEIAAQQSAAKRKRGVSRIVMLVGGAVLLTLILWLAARGGDDAEDQVVAPAATTIPLLPTTIPTLETLPVDLSSPDITISPIETPEGPIVTEFAYGEGECAPADGADKQQREFSAAPKLCIDPAKTYTAEVETNMGSYTAVLDPAKAPGAVNSFVNLARFKYFDDTVCHRAIPGFMVQCGDPTATGSGGPGYDFADELPAAGEYELGSVVMANAGPNTNGSQFFVVTGEQGVSLPPDYVLFGKVTDGFDTTVKKMDEAGNPADNGVPPLKEIKILKVTITEK